MYPEGAHGFLALSHGRFGGCFWFERAEYARINWLPVFLAILQSAVHQVEIGFVQHVDAVVIDPAAQRRELSDGGVDATRFTARTARKGRTASAGAKWSPAFVVVT